MSTDNEKETDRGEPKNQRRGLQNRLHQYKIVAYIVPIGIISEGSKVQLDGSQSYFELSLDSSNGKLSSTSTTRPIEAEDRVSYIWQQVGGPNVILYNANSSKPSFIAPSIDVHSGDNTNTNNNSDSYPTIHTTLKFQLIVKDKESVQSEPVYEEIIVKIVQRALVLQGGGALGAYEVGVFRAFCENLIEKIKDKEEEDYNNRGTNILANRPLFDIIAGTSIGAVNAALIVGNVLRFKDSKLKQIEIWDNSVKQLEKFWDDISNPLLSLIPDPMQNNPLFKTGLSNHWKIIDELNTSLFRTTWEYAKNARDVWNKNYILLSKEVQKQKIANELRVGEKQGTLSSTSYPYWNQDWPYIPIVREEWPYIQWISWRQEWKEEWPYIQSYFYWPENYGPSATVEAARRYYSYANSLIFGAPKVLLPPIQQPDMKFLGPSFTRFDNRPLARAIKKYWDYEKFPIKTSFKELQPRLLLISVDTLDATSAVAFDSYSKENNICKTEYGDEEFRRIIEYPDGITMDHVMASMSTHLKHKYPQMGVKGNGNGHKEENGEDTRIFWDGAYLSNTPLKELLNEHHNYWQQVKKETVILENGEEKILVPDLELYIVNLYPAVENEIPMDADTIQDREIDIKFHDRTRNDVKIAQMTTDYNELIDKIINIGFKHAENDEALKKDLEDLMKRTAKSRNQYGKRKMYKEIIQSNSDIVKVIYVDRLDDGNTIFGKAFEFSDRTVNQLKESGYNDANIALEIESLRNTVSDLIESGSISQNEADLIEQKLHAAITQAKHQNIDKAIERLGELLITALDTAKGKSSEEEYKSQLIKLSRLFTSQGVLLIQLANSKVTVMANKGLLTQIQADQVRNDNRTKVRELKTGIMT